VFASGSTSNLICLAEPSYKTGSLPHAITGETLSFLNARNAGALLTGWSVLEPIGVWSAANAAFLGFIVDGTLMPKHVIVRVAAWLIPGKLQQQRVQIWSGHNKLAEYDLKDENPPELKIPLGDITVNKGTPLILGFYLPDARPANEVVLTTDRRMLGLRLISLRLAP